MPSTCNVEDVSETDVGLDGAIQVLAAEAAALSHITQLYRTDRVAQQGLRNAVATIVEAQSTRGKLVVCGVGKSAYIGMKLVATCKSLGVVASFMHACEALHGDLGDIRADDVLLFVSFSGKTPELLNLLPHIPEATRILAMTSHTSPADCPLLSDCEGGILLPTPIPEKEEEVFGVAAPTISTTVALAVADMLALTVAGQMHKTRAKTKEVFRRNHPGGAIGITHRALEKLKQGSEDRDILVQLPSPSISGSDTG